MKKSKKNMNQNGFGTKRYFIGAGVLMMVAVISMKIAWWFCGFEMDNMNAIGIGISGPKLWLHLILWSISAVLFIAALALLVLSSYIIRKDYKLWRKSL